MNELKIRLRKMLQETFRNVSTDKGIISWDEDTDLPAEGVRVWSVDEEGMEIQVEDGEYRLEDGTIISIKENKVESVIIPEEEPVEEPVKEDEPAQEDEPAEEPAKEDEPIEEPEPENVEEPAEEPVEEPEHDEKDIRIAELETRNAELEAECERLRERIKELEEKSAAEPATETFKKVNKIERPSDSRLGKLYDKLNND